MSLNVARVDHRRALANDSFWRKAAVEIAARTSGLSADSKMTPFELARCLC